MRKLKKSGPGLLIRPTPKRVGRIRNTIKNTCFSRRKTRISFLSIIQIVFYEKYASNIATWQQKYWQENKWNMRCCSRSASSQFILLRCVKEDSQQGRLFWGPSSRVSSALLRVFEAKTYHKRMNLSEWNRDAILHWSLPWNIFTYVREYQSNEIMSC